MGSIIDLITSVDVSSATWPQYELNGVIQDVFRIVTATLRTWTSGSAAVAGSLDVMLGSAGNAIGSLGGQ